MQSIISANKNLQAAIERQKPLVKAAVMDSLLKGGFRTAGEAESALAHVDWQIQGNFFTVLILRVAGYELQVNKPSLAELDFIRAAIEETLVAEVSPEAFLHYLDQDKFAVLLAITAAGPAEFRQEAGRKLRSLINRLSSSYNLRVVCALGGICADLADVRSAYAQACQTLDLQMLKDEDLIWYEDLPREDVRYYYPLELEETLIHLVRTGDRAGVGRLLRDIQAENFEKRSLSAENVQQLLYELRGTVGRAADVSQDEAFRRSCREKLKNSGKIEEFFASMEELLGSVCDAILERGRKGKKALIEGIVGFMQQNYADANFSLTAAASHFKLAPVYLSQLFKEATGENFSDFLERIRLDRACELLLAPDASVGEIARCLGYNSDKAFRRAFKRVKGMSPTDLRKSMLSS